MCLLLELQKLLDTYNTKVTETEEKLKKKIPEFEEKHKETMLSSVVLLLRRHSANNSLCCGDDERNLEVTGINGSGFVMHVKCKECERNTETICYNAKWTYERIYDENRPKLKPGDHICWHRPYAIWHHAIVKSVEPKVKEEATNEGRSK